MTLGEQPLVSIIVVTYNSSKTVLKTLESAKNLQYENVELIISDDASSDETVALCSEWIEVNKSRFVNTHISTIEKNSGIPANCNRGVQAAIGDWVKLIAADDLLDKEAIDSFLTDSEGKNIIAGSYQMFKTINGIDQPGEIRPTKEEKLFFEKSAEEQYQSLLRKAFNFAPSVIFSKSVFETYGPFIEKYFLLEDLPYWLTVCSQGEKIYHTDKVVTYYQIGHESASMSARNFYNLKFEKVYRQFKRDMIYPQIPFWRIGYYQSELARYLGYIIITKLLGNKINLLTRIVNKLAFYLSFDTYQNAFRKYFG